MAASSIPNFKDLPAEHQKSISKFLKDTDKTWDALDETQRSIIATLVMIGDALSFPQQNQPIPPHRAWTLPIPRKVDGYPKRIPRLTEEKEQQLYPVETSQTTDTVQVKQTGRK
jgi:hypothetical protein